MRDAIKNVLIDGYLANKHKAAFTLQNLLYVRKLSVDFRHTNHLECSECKIFACAKKLAHEKKLVG